MSNANEIMVNVIEIVKLEGQRRKDVYDILKGKVKLKSFTPPIKFDVSTQKLSGLLDFLLEAGVIAENRKTKLLEKTSLGEDIALVFRKGLSLSDVIKAGVVELKKVKP